MKKIILAIVGILIATSAWATYNIATFDGLTGGGAALDGRATANLTDGAIAVGEYGGQTYFFRYDTTSTDSESTTAGSEVIIPNDNATGTGAWLVMYHYPPLCTTSTAGLMSAAQATALASIDTEAELEALLELADLQGDLADSQLSANVPLLDGTHTISGTWTFSNGIEVPQNANAGYMQVWAASGDGEFSHTITADTLTANRQSYWPDYVFELPNASTINSTGGLDANTVDSDQYVDESIDNVHLSDGAVDTEELAADAVEGTKIADDAVDSEHIADDAITAALIDDNAVTYAATSGSYKALTPVTDAAADFAANFTGANLYGGTFICDTAGTIQLPAVTAGMSFTIITKGAIAVVVEPNSSDMMMLDGTDLDDADSATNLSTAGDIIVFQYLSSAGWVATSNSWTDED